MMKMSKKNDENPECRQPVNTLVRAAVTADFDRISAFAQSPEELMYFFPRAVYPLTPAQLREAALHRTDATVVEYEGLAVAYANLYRSEPGGICALGNVVVAPNMRGQGIGRLLAAAMIDCAVAKYRATEIRVACFNRNTAGLLLYPEMGFIPFAVEERKGIGGERIALIHLRLVLNPAK